MKKCKSCNEWLDETEYYKDGGGLRTTCKKCIKKAGKTYYKNNKDRIDKKNKQWQENNIGYAKKYKREYYLKNKKSLSESTNRYRKNHPKMSKKSSFKYKLTIRIIALQVYSKGKMRCEICNEEDIDVLTFDHISGKGRKHKNKVGFYHLAEWLVKNNFPTGFRVLCRNCNWKEHLNKIKIEKL